MAWLSLVTTCRGRLAYLEQTLGSLVGQPDCVVIVVDDSCPDHSGDWVETHYPQARVVRREGPPLFNRAAAKNAGAAVVETPWLAFVDADIHLAPSFASMVRPRLEPGGYYRAYPADEGIWGTVVCAHDDFKRVGGYDEIFQGWGEEDNDLYDALEFSGVTGRFFPASLLRHRAHPVALRTRFHAPGDPLENLAVNRIYRRIKWDLSRVRRSVPDIPLRQAIYDLVQVKVREVYLTGRESSLHVALTPEVQPDQWSLARGLTYRIARLVPVEKFEAPPSP